MSDTFEPNATRVVDRFLRYVRIDTTSAEDSPHFPSTAVQLDLARLLAEELRELGLTDAVVDQYGYVFATLPSNLPPQTAQQIPVIAFIAHVDTYFGVSGKDVQPVVHRAYGGGDIALPGDPAQVIRADENPELANFVGDDIITSDGTTLLGADDKAGVAEIMAAVEYLVQHPEIPRGTVKIAFTPDEEVGNGTKYFDVAKFGAAFAYTIDGGYPGEVENETFCADTAIVQFAGRDVHPGYAKGKMVNAVRAAAYFAGLYSEESLPETTSDRQGYIHPYQLEGNVSAAKLTTLIRDFTVEGLGQFHDILNSYAAITQERFPGVDVDVQIKESYRNMIYKLQEEPRVMDYAVEAVQRAGVEPILKAIRGGTDGARLSYMGLLTPNLFAGGMNFHSKQEWVAVGAMVKAVETILHLVQVWRERSLDER